MGTDGFEFVEYTAPDSALLDGLFEKMGFSAVARHRSKRVVLYRQGDVNFVVNHEPDSFARAFAKVHGPSACAFAIRVADAGHAHAESIKRGAAAHHGPVGPMELDVDFVAEEGVPSHPHGAGLTHVDHLTHNVHHGRMDEWAGFYERLFNFEEIRFFDIHGERTGLKSRAMASPCGKIRIPINEPSDDKSQIQEYLEAYRGEGIQHIALASDDIHATVETLSANGIRFMDVPDTYYEAVDERVPGHGEDLDRLKKNKVLVDGAPEDGQGLLLQIFTETVIGPIFFEIIQRKGNEGFGEGNFQALFEAIERDQMARGVI
jgi:4-hydroxyphenylpyruvate dioxygenase